jgi:hypothetical protein
MRKAACVTQGESMFNLPKIARTEPKPQGASNSGRDSSGKSGSDISATQREMVFTAFKDTMRITGVPSSFIECECIHFVNSKNVTQFQVRLIMKKWSGQMLRYSLAFQNQMRTYLDRFEPNVDHSAYEWLWKYAADCDAPFPNMPAPEEWAKKKEPAAPPRQPVDFFERRKTPRPPKGNT